MIIINKLNNSSLSEIKSILDSSGIIIFPTETVWGIGCKYDDKNAVDKIYKIKGRNFSNPLQIQLSKVSDIELYSTDKIKGNLRKICDKYLPGPLSIVLKKQNVPDFVTSNLNSVSVRISNCLAVTQLIEFIGYPLASTSCNLSGEPVLTKFEDVKAFAELYGDIFVSIESEANNISSTVISYFEDDVQLLREGVVKFEELLNCIR